MKSKTAFILLITLNIFYAQEIVDKDAFKKCRESFSKKFCLSDKDKDSVLFYLDNCPKVFGENENGGCPWKDTDKDSIIDKDDICPEVKGLPEYHGCPIPDMDEDGILDNDDACPTIFGYASDDPLKNGCMKEDCKKKYKEGQVRLKKLQDESTFVDYDRLKEKILNNIDLKLLTEDNIVILTKYQILLCGTTGKNYNCLNYDYMTPIFSTEDFWSEKIIEKVYDKIPKNIILATISEGEGAGIRYEKNIILNETNRSVKIINEYTREDNAILYSKLINKDLRITKYNTLSIVVSKNDFGNKIEVKTTYTKSSYSYCKTFITTYHYIDKDWIATENRLQIEN